MPEPDPEAIEGELTNRRLRITLIGICVSVLLVAVGYAVLTYLQTPFFSPPDQPRPWAKVDFDETIHGSLVTHPVLSAIDPMAISSQLSEDELELETAGPKSISAKRCFEVFPADESNKVSLPTGNRLKLAGIAILRPQDVPEDKIDNGSMLDITWLDPLTLEPLPEAKVKDWEKRKWFGNEESELHLMIDNEGGAPIRWLGASGFDERTHLRVSSGTSFQSHGVNGQFGIDLGIWHQTPLRLTADFAYGEPEIQDLTLEPDAEIRFGDKALVRVVALTPNPINSVSWSSGGSSGSIQKSTSTFRWKTELEPSRDRGRGVVFHVWPAHAERMIDYEIVETGDDGKTRLLNAWGNEGIARGEIPEADEIKAFRARRMPHLGRAVFRLPRIPDFPEVKNLFEAPIPRVHLRYTSQMEKLVRQAAGVQSNSWRGVRSIPDSAFPITLENTTPLEVLRLNEQLAGRLLFFDRKALTVTAEKRGMLTDLKKWWSRHKPTWLP